MNIICIMFKNKLKYLQRNVGLTQQIRACPFIKEKRIQNTQIINFNHIYILNMLYYVKIQ